MYLYLGLMLQAGLLSTFPFIFYWFTRPLPKSSARAMVGTTKVVLGILCAGYYLIVCAMYAISWFGSTLSGGGPGPYPSARLVQDPLQVPLILLVVPPAAVLLAVATKGNLGLWVFAMGASFISYWAGLVWLPVEMDWRFVIAFAVIGGLCGMVAGFIQSLVSHPHGSIGKVLFWPAVGASSASLGIVASWPAVQQATRWISFGKPGTIDYTPFSIDPGMMLPTVLTIVVVWLALSTMIAIATGYIRGGEWLLTKMRGT